MELSSPSGRNVAATRSASRPRPDSGTGPARQEVSTRGPHGTARAPAGSPCRLARPARPSSGERAHDRRAARPFRRAPPRRADRSRWEAAPRNTLCNLCDRVTRPFGSVLTTPTQCRSIAAGEALRQLHLASLYRRVHIGSRLDRLYGDYVWHLCELGADAALVDWDSAYVFCNLAGSLCSPRSGLRASMPTWGR